MDYCGPHGIPHSHFLGGPLVWTQSDRDKALWWVIHDRQRCQSCGTRPYDFATDEHAFVAKPTHCRGCEIRAQADEQFEKNRGQYRRGTSIVLVRAPEEVPDAASGSGDAGRAAAEVQGAGGTPP